VLNENISLLLALGLWAVLKVVWNGWCATLSENAILVECMVLPTAGVKCCQGVWQHLVTMITLLAIEVVLHR